MDLVKKPKGQQCELCGCEDDVLNFHHLIPKKLHKNKYFKEHYKKDFLESNGIWICTHYCHPEIHKYIFEKKMGRNFNTLELLLAHPKVRKYVEWRKNHHL
jgi:hypothetical protein